MSADKTAESQPEQAHAAGRVQSSTAYTRQAPASFFANTIQPYWTWCRAKLWVASCACIPAAIGAVQVKEYAFAAVLFVAAGIFLSIYSFSWSGAPDRPILTRLVRFWLLTIGISMIPFSVVWVDRQKGDDTWSVFLRNDRQPPAPTLVLRYKPTELPISIQPNTTEYVMPLSPVAEGLWELANTKNDHTWWPEKPPLRDGKGLGQAYVGSITNDANKALLDVRISFDLEFYSAIRVKASTGDKHGKSSISVEQPGPDQSSFAYYWKGKITAARSGELVSKRSREVVAPDIKARSSVNIYMVSQTILFSRVRFPTKAPAVVDGDPNRRMAVLIRPPVNVLDQVPYWTLNPSIYQWLGVPDSWLDLENPPSGDWGRPLD